MKRCLVCFCFFTSIKNENRWLKLPELTWKINPHNRSFTVDGLKRSLFFQKYEGFDSQEATLCSGLIKEATLAKVEFSHI